MAQSTLAERMQVTTHISPLRYKLRRLMRADRLASTLTVEEWLIDVANSRKAVVIQRKPKGERAACPGERKLSNEELVIACCQPNAADEPQLLRPAAQLISRGGLDLRKLLLVARRERATRILAELARQALRVEPDHTTWLAIRDALKDEPPLCDVLIHWTRLAEPQMVSGKPNAHGWRLVS